jgi:agmatine deiminase
VVAATTTTTRCWCCLPACLPARALIGLDWGFNGWGDLPGSYENDKKVAGKICELERLPYISLDMILEGGSIHTDGEG